MTETEATPPPLATRLSWTRADQWALGIITFIAGAIRIMRVANPGDIMFDETYYAKDACWYLLADPSVCEIDVEQYQVHPPLAKWLIAIGIRIFGFDSLGWRIMSVVAGTLTVVILYLLARKLLNSTLGASLAAGLLAFDFLHFVQSRIAMLDIFVPLFGMAAILFLVYDREQLLARFARGTPPERTEDGDPPPERVIPGNGLLDRPWRIWAGIAGSAAVASKWTGGLFLAAVILLTIIWEVRVRLTDDRPGPIVRFLKEESLTIIVWLMVFPLILYIATYAGRFPDKSFFVMWNAEESWMGALIDQHKYMFDFHRGLEASHTYQSPPWSWILLKRPVSYWFCSGSSCSPPIADSGYSEIFAAGSPLVWWSSVLALVFTAWRWLTHRRLSGPEGVILAGFIFTYVPWLHPDFADRGAVFIFYLLPAVPFMCLALAYAGINLGRSLAAKIAVSLYCAMTLGLFAFYYPLLANVPIQQSDWNKRIWVFNNCDKPPGEEVTTQITETTRRKTVVKDTTTLSDATLPPKGWCWI
ncbi:MAG TPA: phospholipid carrier-dependent glycosyltransferase [Actinomycetota bacterium]|nr:phospholipid carrier-dependent glycosyltransferase [Actinomycetota bacterium]